MSQAGAPPSRGESALQRNRRTIEAVFYGVGLLVEQLRRDDDAPGGGNDEAAVATFPDALFAHIRHLLEQSFGPVSRASACLRCRIREADVRCELCAEIKMSSRFTKYAGSAATNLRRTRTCSYTVACPRRLQLLT